MTAVPSEIDRRFAVLPPKTANGPRMEAEGSAPAEPAADGLKPFGEDGFSFLDLLDIVNPLQHLPVISTFYREWTGDSLSPAARIAGDILYGGPIGAFIGINNAITESATGKDIGQHVLAFLRGTDDSAPGEPAPGEPPAALVADVTTPTPEPAIDKPVAAAFAVQPPAQPVAANSARDMAMQLDGGVSIVDPRQVTFAPPARSRIPLAPKNDTTASAATIAAVKPAAVPQVPATPGLGRGPLFAVVPPPPAPLFGPGPAGASAVAPPTAPAPAGSAALDGGWFSDAMLSALRKYRQESAPGLDAASAGHTASAMAEVAQ